MDHELLEQKADFFAERDETFSSIKHEFSRIFHENNLHSFANASDIGFLDIGKLANQGFSGDYEDIHGLGEMDMFSGRPYPKEEMNPYMGMNMHNAYSPMRFLPPNNVGFNPNFSTMTSAPQKQQPMQEANIFQSYQPYKYTDYSYLDYAAAQPANHLFSQNMYDMYNPPDMIDTHPNNPLSLMWSNDAPKAVHKKSLTPEDLVQSNQNVALNKFSAAPLDIPTQKAQQIPFKIEQDFEKVSHKAIGQQLDRIKTGPDSAGIAPRRTNRVTKPLYNNASLINDVEEEDSGSDEDKDESFGDTKNRSSRGLRVLSLKVRDIVSKKKKTSYKEVAEALLQDLSQKLKGKSQAEISKEEQNVKRRVYDALNVLIAADILRKEGKLVCCEVPAGNFGGQSKKKSKIDKSTILEQIQELKKKKKEKVEALQELVFKSLAIRNLVRRNKEKVEKEAAEKNKAMYGQNAFKPKKAINGAPNNAYVNATRIDVVQENASLKQKTQDVISFPFIVLLSSSPENSMNLNMDTSQKQLSIESKKPFNIFGDIDVLLKMRLHYVSREIFEKEVSKELRKYVSQSFVDALK